ncbi:3'-5' exonuclease [Vibrio rumoiensis]|uniref:DNA polymerase III subunit epsilon n=1 Tax=Vibrio rumoiensis 1S-45 TaxID=1188252 RepID=A0A1E5E6F2_9VIBR|nr:3'-5' exonuclease [Vibrio rumoiensis]OEF29403.1 DNA polymerase III subunit epsilon [Vibrio rumoiensis 1S-45]
MNSLQRLWWYYQLNGSKYQPLFRSIPTDEFVSLDCETTSLNPKQAELVTIAATKIIDNKIITSEPFHIRLKAPQSLNEHSIRIHKMRHHDLEDGYSEEEGLQKLLDFIGNRPLVGYHIRYDKTILDRAYKKHFGFPLPNPLIEVSHLYHERLERLLPNAYCDLSLEAICRHLDLPIQERHDALQDTITAALIYVRLTHGSLPNPSLAYKK